MNEPTITSGTVSNEDVEKAQMLSHAMNQPITLWKLIEILKEFGVIDKEMTDTEVLERISDNL